MDEMKVLNIVNESDRLLLYGDEEDYHLIASPTNKVKVGDIVEYEPCGINFGWFKRVLSSSVAAR